MSRDSVRKSLQETLGPAEWSLLRKHASRDALIIVDPTLEIIEAGTAIALNEEAQVKSWIEHGKLSKPTVEQLTIWEKDLSRTFISLIVQPFVLIQTQNQI